MRHEPLLPCPNDLYIGQRQCQTERLVGHRQSEKESMHLVSVGQYVYLYKVGIKANSFRNKGIDDSHNSRLSEMDSRVSLRRSRRLSKVHERPPSGVGHLLTPPQSLQVGKVGTPCWDYPG